MSGKKSQEISSYLQYLPALLQSDNFLGRFLLAFEEILSGLESSNSHPNIIDSNSSDSLGLEEIIDNIHLYLDPSKTPDEFLPWLASWVAVTLREDWDLRAKRDFISKIVPLYRLRGTKAGLEQMLKIFLGNQNEEVRIYEFDLPAHYFQVELELASQDLKEYRRKEKIARAIIDKEKPAHTFYALQIQMPTMRIVSETLAKEEKLEPPQRYMLRIGNWPNHNNNTVLGTKSGKDIQSSNNNSK